MTKICFGLSDFFVGEPDRCERLVAALQLCTTSTANEVGLLRHDDFTSSVEKGSLSRQLLDLKNLQLFEQLQTLCDNFPEFNERFDVLGTHIEVSRNSVSESLKAMLAVLTTLNTSVSRFSQPSVIVLDFRTSNEEHSSTVPKNTGDILVLNLEESVKSKQNRENNIPNEESSFTFVLHISNDVNLTQVNTKTTERLEFPYIIDVITKISEKYTVSRPERSVTISMAVLLPVISLNEQHAEDFALHVQSLRRKEMEGNILSLRLTADEIAKKVEDEKERIERESSISRPSSRAHLQSSSAPQSKGKDSAAHSRHSDKRSATNTHENPPDPSLVPKKIQSATTSFGSIHSDKDDKIALSPFQTNDPNSSSIIPDNMSVNGCQVDPPDVLSAIDSARSVFRDADSADGKADMKYISAGNVPRNISRERQTSMADANGNNNEEKNILRADLTRETTPLTDLRSQSVPVTEFQKESQRETASTVDVYPASARTSKIPPYSAHKDPTSSAAKVDTRVPVSDPHCPLGYDRIDGPVPSPFASSYPVSPGKDVTDQPVDVCPIGSTGINAAVADSGGRGHTVEYAVEEQQEVEGEEETDKKGEEMEDRMEEEEWQEETEAYRNLISKFDRDASLLHLINESSTTNESNSVYGVDPLRASLVDQLLRSTNLGSGSFASSDLHQEDEMSAASYGLHAYTAMRDNIFSHRSWAEESMDGADSVKGSTVHLPSLREVEKEVENGEKEDEREGGREEDVDWCIVEAEGTEREVERASVRVSPMAISAFSSTTEDQGGLEDSTINIRASLTSVTDEKVLAAIGIISKAIEVQEKLMQRANSTRSLNAQRDISKWDSVMSGTGDDESVEISRDGREGDVLGHFNRIDHNSQRSLDLHSTIEGYARVDESDIMDTSNLEKVEGERSQMGAENTPIASLSSLPLTALSSTPRSPLAPVESVEDVSSVSTAAIDVPVPIPVPLSTRRGFKDRIADLDFSFQIEEEKQREIEEAKYDAEEDIATSSCQGHSTQDTGARSQKDQGEELGSIRYDHRMCSYSKEGKDHSPVNTTHTARSRPTTAHRAEEKDKEKDKEKGKEKERERDKEKVKGKKKEKDKDVVKGKNKDKDIERAMEMMKSKQILDSIIDTSVTSDALLTSSFDSRLAVQSGKTGGTVIDFDGSYNKAQALLALLENTANSGDVDRRIVLSSRGTDGGRGKGLTGPPLSLDDECGDALQSFDSTAQQQHELELSLLARGKKTDHLDGGNLLGFDSEVKAKEEAMIVEIEQERIEREEEEEERMREEEERIEREEEEERMREEEERIEREEEEEERMREEEERIEREEEEEERIEREEEEEERIEREEEEEERIEREEEEEERIEREEEEEEERMREEEERIEREEEEEEERMREEEERIEREEEEEEERMREEEEKIQRAHQIVQEVARFEEYEKEERARMDLIANLALCREMIENRRHASLEELFRRRKVQGLEILSRLALGPPTPTPVTVAAPSSFSSSSSSASSGRQKQEQSAFDHDEPVIRVRRGWGVKDDLFLPRTAELAEGHGQSECKSAGVRSHSPPDSVLCDADREPPSLPSRPKSSRKAKPPGDVTATREIDRNREREMERDRLGARERGNSIERDGAAEVANQREREGQRGIDEVTHVPQVLTSGSPSGCRTVRSGGVGTGSRILSPKAALSDAQKDSIVRQIRAASAGRVRREPTTSTTTDINLEGEGGGGEEEDDTESRKGGGGGVHEIVAEKGVRARVDAGQVVKATRPEVRSIQPPVDIEGSRDRPRGVVAAIQQPSSSQPGASIQGDEQSLDSRTRSRGRGDVDLKGDRETRHADVLERDRRDQVGQENEKRQREEKETTRRRGSVLELEGGEDEAKRLAKFERMREKKIAEAQARALEKDRAKSRGRVGSGIGSPSPVPGPFLVSVPPLPADIAHTRRRTLQPSDVSNGPRSTSPTRASSVGRYHGPDRDGHSASHAVHGIGSGSGDDAPFTQDADGGYLQHHVTKAKDKDKERRSHAPRSNSSLKGRSGDKDEGLDEGENEMENEDATVRSHTSSLSLRSAGTGNKGRAPSAGRAVPSASYGGRPKALSNLQQVRNAVNLVCLAGAHFDVQRIEAVRAIEQCSMTVGDLPAVTQVLVLVSCSKSLSFKALYAVNPIDGSINRIYGRGPKVLLVTYVDEFFKYESSSRSFKALTTKTLTGTTDAVSIDAAKLKKLLGIGGGGSG